MNLPRLLSLLLLLAASLWIAPAGARQAVLPDGRDARMAWFRDARFGMFVHFGLYSVYGGVWKGEIRKVNRCAEWMMLAAQAPRDEYAKAAVMFNPVDFDAERWVRMLRDAGMRYLVVTAKHHEGFAMFRTAASPYNIVEATPFGRDVIGEIAEACHRQGVRLGFYYSQNLDWYHPGGGGQSWDPPVPDTPEARDRYVDTIVIPQLRELLTQYGTVDILWYDIPGGVVSPEKARAIDAMVRELQPDILVNNRLGHGVPYDIQTPENFIPATGIPGCDWESCMTFNHSWGFAADDQDWKSARFLIRRLADTASKGGNLLLNVGPDAYGRFPGPVTERLSAVGAWLRNYGEAIYGTRASCFAVQPEWGRFTVRPAGPDGRSELNVIVFEPPADGRIPLPGLTNAILGARLLGPEAREIPVEAGPDGPVLMLPSGLPAADFAIAVTLRGDPAVTGVQYAGADGTIPLLPAAAVCGGDVRHARVEISGLRAQEPHLTGWGAAGAFAEWRIRVPSAGRYALGLRIIGAREPRELRAVCGGKVTVLSVPPGNGEPADCGGILLDLPAGESTLRLEADASGAAVGFVRGVLSPR